MHEIIHVVQLCQTCVFSLVAFGHVSRSVRRAGGRARAAAGPGAGACGQLRRAGLRCVAASCEPCTRQACESCARQACALICAGVAVRRTHPGRGAWSRRHDFRAVPAETADARYRG